MTGTYCPNMNGCLDICISQKSRIALLKFNCVLDFDSTAKPRGSLESGREWQPARVTMV